MLVTRRSATGRDSVVGAATGADAPPDGVPQLLQNRAPGSRGSPQPAQVTAVGAPHSWQKRAPSTSPVAPQEPHVVMGPTLPATRRPDRPDALVVTGILPRRHTRCQGLRRNRPSAQAPAPCCGLRATVLPRWAESGVEGGRLRIRFISRRSPRRTPRNVPRPSQNNANPIVAATPSAPSMARTLSSSKARRSLLTRSAHGPEELVAQRCRS